MIPRKKIAECVVLMIHLQNFIFITEQILHNISPPYISPLFCEKPLEQLQELLGLLRVDPVAGALDVLERRPGEGLADLVVVRHGDVVGLAAADEDRPPVERRAAHVGEVGCEERDQ